MLHFLAHFLLPRHTNNHKPKFLHNSSLVIIAFLVIAIHGLGSFVYKRTGSVLGFAANISIDEVVRLTNQKRAEHGLPALTFNGTLSGAAVAKANDMLAKDYWAHIAPDGTTPWQFFKNAGFAYKFAGENLARDFSSAQAAVDAWMASASHRENLLSTKYKEIGIGVAEGDLAGQDTTLIVQFFGTRLSDSLPVAPVAAAATAKPVAQAMVTAVAKPIATPISTPKATVAPTPVATPTVLPTVIAQATPQTLVAGSLNVSKIVVSGLIIGLIIVLGVDLLLVHKLKIVRIGGRNLAHMAFLGMILAIVLIAKAGEII